LIIYKVAFISNCFFLQAADLKAPIDDRVVEHVNYLVNEGVCNVGEMMRHIRLFVKTTIGHNNIPSSNNRKFYPTRSDIRKLIYRQRQRILNGLLDQDYLELKIKTWQTERPHDFFYFRKSEINVASDNTQQKKNLLILYQASWQKYLLNRYGNEFVLLDATYKTTQYALPLFFLCVQTNNGYCVVATMIMENEDTSSLSEALEILKTENSTWHPAAFMIDASDIEMNAIGAIFKGINFLQAFAVTFYYYHM
jgi:hypothetical protein